MEMCVRARFKDLIFFCVFSFNILIFFYFFDEIECGLDTDLCMCNVCVY